MKTKSKRWIFAPDPPTEFVKGLPDLGQIMAKVLYNRGLTMPAKAREFLDGELLLHDPMLMKDMDKAITRIRTAIRNEERIVVYGDFDADGVTSTALLVQTLHALGAKPHNIKPYIPNRVDEGPGLNMPALQKLAAEGYQLVITVDCGIRSVEEVEAGNAVGIDFIITDHHSVGETLPSAYAILNPKQEDCPYPEDMLAAVGIAFKLASALLRVAQQDPSLPNLHEHDLLDLVALGTVADLAPLDRFENRRLVQLGLEKLAEGRRKGILELMQISRIKPEKVKASSIGYGLGPRINAAGRLEDALIAYELLMTDDAREAVVLSRELQSINIERQHRTADMYERARKMVLANGSSHALLFAADDTFAYGITGLVAGRLTEEFYRPSVVIEIDPNREMAYGSCRSIPEFHILNALDECADFLTRHGGHAQAAGFTIPMKNLDNFKQKLGAIASRELTDYDLQPILSIDAEVEIINLTMELAELLRKLEPLGTGNPEPVFVATRLRVSEKRRVGNEGKHLKLRLSDGPNSFDAIAFGFGNWYYELTDYIDVAFHLQINEYRRRMLQMNIVDIHLIER